MAALIKPQKTVVVTLALDDEVAPSLGGNLNTNDKQLWSSDESVIVNDSLTVSEGIGLYGKSPPSQGSAIADCNESHTVAALFDNLEVNNALDDLGSKLNLVLQLLRDLGVISE